MFTRLRFFLGAGLGAAALAGCATDAHQVKVDAIAKPAAAPKASTVSYRLKSKNPALGEENLRYKEVADYVRTALSGRGLYEAPQEDLADMVVELEFGMDSSRTKMQRMNVPVYASVGGGVRYDTVPTTDAKGNTSMRTVAVYEPPRSELVGYDDVPRQVAIYEKYLRITARESRSSSEGKPPAELWSVQAVTEDESKDLRKYLPLMASATVEFIGQDTGHQTSVRVRETGSDVQFIRRGIFSGTAGVAVPPKP